MFYLSQCLLRFISGNPSSYVDSAWCSIWLQREGVCNRKIGVRYQSLNAGRGATKRQGGGGKSSVYPFEKKGGAEKV